MIQVRESIARSRNVVILGAAAAAVLARNSALAATASARNSATGLLRSRIAKTGQRTIGAGRKLRFWVAPFAGTLILLSKFRLANQRIGFLRFAACADSQGVWHGGKVSGYGER